MWAQFLTLDEVIEAMGSGKYEGQRQTARTTNDRWMNEDDKQQEDERQGDERQGNERQEDEQRHNEDDE